MPVAAWLWSDHGVPRSVMPNMTTQWSSHAMRCAIAVKDADDRGPPCERLPRSVDWQDHIGEWREVGVEAPGIGTDAAHALRDVPKRGGPPRTTATTSSQRQELISALLPPPEAA